MHAHRCSHRSAAALCFWPGSGDERGLPVGILIQTFPDGRGNVVRWDLARALLLAHEGTKAPAVTTRDGLFAWTDEWFDAGTRRAGRPTSSTPAARAAGAPNGVHARTDRGYARSLARMTKPVDRVIVQFAANHAPRGVSITTTDDPKDPLSWAPEHYCAVRSGSTQVECQLGPRIIRDVRVTVDGRRRRDRTDSCHRCDTGALSVRHGRPNRE